MNFLSLLSFLLAFMFVLAGTNNENQEEITKIVKPSGSPHTVISEAENPQDIEIQDSDSFSLSEEDIDEEYKNERKKYKEELGINPEDYKTQKKLPFVIQATPSSVVKVINKGEEKKQKVVEEEKICYTMCTALDYLQLYVPKKKKVSKSGNIKEYNDFVYVGIEKDKKTEVTLIPTCPMESSQQNPLREHFLNNAQTLPDDISKAIIINILQPVKALKNTKYIFWPSTEPCKNEIELSFFKASPKNRNYHEYQAGYVVKMDEPVEHCIDNTKHLADDMVFFHVGFFGIDKNTEDTIFAHHYIPYYDVIRDMETPTAVYTNYNVNEIIYPQGMSFDRIYEQSNQRRIFEKLLGSNYQTYFNPEKGLELVKQELIDQKMLPMMTFKQLALSYINIVPMFKTIRDNAWTTIEKEISRIPAVTTITILSGVLKTLEINETSIYLDDEINGEVKKRITVPKVFYKFVIAYTEHHETHFIHKFGMYIITHNDPFDTNPQKVCERDDIIPCERFGNLKEIENSMYGITYCCKHSDNMLNVLGIEKHNIENHYEFDINELKKVVGKELLNKSSKRRKIPKVNSSLANFLSFFNPTKKHDKAIAKLEKILKKRTVEMLSDRDSKINENANLSGNSNPPKNSSPTQDSSLTQNSGASELSKKDH